MFRRGTQADVERIFDVYRRAFTRFQGDAKHLEDKYSSIARAPEEWIIFGDEGRHVGQILLHSMRTPVGRSAKIYQIDPADVAIDSQLQARGYGQAMMREFVEYIRELGAATSRLGGYSSFYRRFGYTIMPRTRLWVRVGNEAEMGNSVIRYTALPIPAGRRVRDLGGGRFACGEASCKYSHIDKSASMRLEYAQGDFADAGALIKYAYNLALEAGCNELNVAAPFSRSLYRELMDCYVYFELRELYGANMMRIVSLSRFAEDLLPAFSERLARADISPAAFALSTERERVSLAWDGERVEFASDDSRADIEPRTTQEHLLYMAEGLCMAQEYGFSGREAALLNALFGGLLYDRRTLG